MIQNETLVFKSIEEKFFTHAVAWSIDESLKAFKTDKGFVLKANNQASEFSFTDFSSFTILKTRVYMNLKSYLILILMFFSINFLFINNPEIMPKLTVVSALILGLIFVIRWRKTYSIVFSNGFTLIIDRNDKTLNSLQNILRITNQQI
ncbi:hypothetical protein KEM09_12470 [Carboxylicivirga mesophila]|uniref:Uncharacterized protein n=1 Tax=Carboxylicivirga mesophila TaxID=1166478 RepID=A0ABS5KBA2_9BACT|nr:hypothetical protein [Carboxylicivirga mesophila]MBS2212224.1 hypothetical protein [Carboxylicivirga mesophila]